VLRGGDSNPAVQRANELLSIHIPTSLVTVDGAAHFLISTHAEAVAAAIARHVARAEWMRERAAIFEADKRYQYAVCD
jgi:pimeloyl-ACP methyl ester carboxylesterase